MVNAFLVITLLDHFFRLFIRNEDGAKVDSTDSYRKNFASDAAIERGLKEFLSEVELTYR